MEKKTYLCGDCGSVFEEKNIIVNLKDRLGKESFKSILQNPIKRFSELIAGRVCPQCGSDKVMEVNERVEAQLPEYLISGWDSSLLNESMDIDIKNVVASESKSVFKDFMEKTIGFFNGKIGEYKEKYNASELMGKIASVAKKAGASTVYYALLIYYALMSDKVPTSKKVIAIAALGYFIAPVDFIPDFILMGLLDDGSVLLFAINQILPYITDDVKAKALAKLNDWFGETDIVAVKSGFMPGRVGGKVESSINIVETQEAARIIEKEAPSYTEIPKNTVNTASAYNYEKKINEESGNIVIIAPYRELNAYIAKRFNQPISLSYGNENEIKVTYTKRIVFNMSVNIRIVIEEVKDDSVLLSYDVAFGLDSIISGALSFIKRQFPELSEGIHPEDGHRIRINLPEIENAKPLVENIALRSITPCENSLNIEFGLKVSN